MKMLEKALEIRLDKLGNRHPDVAQSYHNIGSALYSQGKYEEAMKMHQKALDIRLEVFGNSHNEVASTYVHMGNVLTNQKQHNNALVWYEQALGIYSTCSFLPARKYDAEEKDVHEKIEMCW